MNVLFIYWLFIYLGGGGYIAHSTYKKLIITI